MNLIRSIINFFGFNDAIVDGIGERGMRDSSIIRYNEVHDMYDKIIKDLLLFVFNSLHLDLD